MKTHEKPGPQFFCGHTEWHKNQIIAQHEDGTVLLKFSSNQKQMVFSWAMSFGDSVTVIKPARLREEICTEGRKMVEKYGGG